MTIIPTLTPQISSLRDLSPSVSFFPAVSRGHRGFLGTDHVRNPGKDVYVKDPFHMNQVQIMFVFRAGVNVIPSPPSSRKHRRYAANDPLRSPSKSLKQKSLIRPGFEVQRMIRIVRWSRSHLRILVNFSSAPWEENEKGGGEWMCPSVVVPLSIHRRGGDGGEKEVMMEEKARWCKCVFLLVASL